MLKIPKLTVSWASVIPDLPQGILLALILVAMFTGVMLIRKKLMKNQNQLLPS